MGYKMIKEKLIKLLEIKSILTLVFSLAFVYLCLTSKDTNTLKDILLLTLSNYFSYQNGKNSIIKGDK